ncbi:MAG: hypothetical protein IJT36_03545 [Alphaproteobacteria bacterium]|nr:hypothetical protein [Alphaproteobacteria bacterium]
MSICGSCSLNSETDVKENFGLVCHGTDSYDCHDKIEDLILELQHENKMLRIALQKSNTTALQMIKREKAETYLRNLVKNNSLEYLTNGILNDEENSKYFEIVEDTYEYEDGLCLILYFDAECKKEAWHICVNVDEF